MSSEDERSQAARIADRLLDEPYADPDDDIRVLARQFNRSQEEIERLRETLNFPRLTLTASVEQIKAVLHDHDKGRPVNGQDLINALMWRIDNQRREIVRLNEALRRKASDEAPSFSPNFDERNGIR